MVTEVIEFKLVARVDTETFLDLTRQVELEFHARQPGYVDSELCIGAGGVCCMVMHWQSMSAAKQAVAAMMQAAETESFRQAIDPQSVHLFLGTLLQTWPS